MTAHHGRCDGSGRFRIELPRTSSARHDRLVATAMAPGYGIGWAELDPDADPPPADIALRPEQVIRGPDLRRAGPARAGRRAAGPVGSRPSRAARPRPRLFRARPHREPPWHDLPGWPGPAIERRRGPFHPARARAAADVRSSTVDDPRFASATTLIRTDAPMPTPGPRARPGDQGRARTRSKPIAIALQPARTIVGRVTYADTGQPVPHALVTLGAVPIRRPMARDGSASAAAAATMRSFSIRAQSPDGAPYLIAEKQGRMAQGGGRAVGRPGPAPGRGRPRQGHRGGHGPARRRGGRVRHSVPRSPTARPRI